MIFIVTYGLLIRCLLILSLGEILEDLYSCKEQGREGVWSPWWLHQGGAKEGGGRGGRSKVLVEVSSVIGLLFSVVGAAILRDYVRGFWLIEECQESLGDVFFLL